VGHDWPWPTRGRLCERERWGMKGQPLSFAGPLSFEASLLGPWPSEHSATRKPNASSFRKASGTQRNQTTHI
jgi:hypothetical protein